jgi:ATP phosphoribosyltransferase regulatory subunit HisZ
VGALANLRAILDLVEATPAAGRIKLDPSLARGLSYYTGAIMEINVADLAGSLGGGGRYDNLVGMFLGLPGIVLGPAVGAIALEYARNPNFERALKAGVGAFLGFVLGSAVKVSLAFVLVGVLVLALVY